MAAEAHSHRTYGNWRRPRPPGLWHLGLISSVLFGVGIIATIVVMALVGLVPGLVVLSLQAPLFLVTLKPGAEGRTPLQRARRAPRRRVGATQGARTCTGRDR